MGFRPLEVSLKEPLKNCLWRPLQIRLKPTEIPRRCPQVLLLRLPFRVLGFPVRASGFRFGVYWPSYYEGFRVQGLGLRHVAASPEFQLQIQFCPQRPVTYFGDGFCEKQFSRAPAKEQVLVCYGTAKIRRPNIRTRLEAPRSPRSFLASFLFRAPFGARVAVPKRKHTEASRRRVRCLASWPGESLWFR